MKKNNRASKTEKNNSFAAKIRDFVSLNAFALLLLLLGVWFHQVFVVGSTVDTLVDNQNKMIRYLKENVNKVYFLSASGMAISVDKSNVSYADERFKSYISNEIVSQLIHGNIIFSSNYEKTYASPEKLLMENKNIHNFFTRFVKPHGTVIAPYVRSLHRAMVEGRYPEYISVVSKKYESYFITKPNESNGFKTSLKGTLVFQTVVKSWIRDLKDWDTRKVEIRVKFKALIDLDKYVNLSNPFGLHFTELEVPILHKPTGTQIRDEQR